MVILVSANKGFSLADEDSNGMIDPEELKCCFHKLEISCVEEEISDLFKACDLTENMGMKFNEFIVLLCLVYLLKEPAALQAVSFDTFSVLCISPSFHLGISSIYGTSNIM